MGSKNGEGSPLCISTGIFNSPQISHIGFSLLSSTFTLSPLLSFKFKPRFLYTFKPITPCLTASLIISTLLVPKSGSFILLKSILTNTPNLLETPCFLMFSSDSVKDISIRFWLPANVANPDPLKLIM